jgi:predicted TIM-barrel fold metal-dependent hydrolase
MTRGLVLDGHVHWGEWKKERVGWPPAALPEIQDALARSGIDGAVLMPTDLADNAGLLAALEPRPRHIYFFPWIDPRPSARTMDFLERNAAKIDGLKIHPSLEQLRVDDPAWAPFLEFAEARRIPVIVHCGRWQEMASWRFCLEAAERHLNAPFIVGHLGGDLPTLQQECSLEMARRQLPNAYLGTESIREYYSLRIALDRLGPSRVIFGSDYPLGWPAAYLAVLEGAKPSKEEKRAVLGENLLSLFARRSP